MSEATPDRAWQFYIDDMIAFAEAVLAYTDGMDCESFVASRLKALAATDGSPRW